MSTEIQPRAGSSTIVDADTTGEALQRRGGAAIEVVYLLAREALSSVFLSQVLNRFGHHTSDRVNIRIAVLSPVGQLLRPALRRRSNELKRIASETYGLTLSYLPLPPSRIPWLWQAQTVFAAWLRRQYAPGQALILHCRNAPMTSLALRVRELRANTKVIFDCRGAECDEFLEGHRLNADEASSWSPGLRRRYEALVECEEQVVSSSDAIFCVSHAMVKHLEEKYALTDSEVAVVPCCVDTERFREPVADRAEIRRKLGFDGKFVVTYCGSYVWYQMPEESLRVFALIRESIPEAHFFSLTTHPQRWQAVVDNAGISEGVTIRSVNAESVPEHLVASDVGLLLRKNTIVNRVASPVKFGEYMASGVPIISTEGVGDYSAAIGQQALGGLVDLSLEDDALREVLRRMIIDGSLQSSEARRRCREFAASQLSWQRYVPVGTAAYERLAPGGRAETCLSLTMNRTADR